MKTKPNIQLIELCDKIRSDPSNAGYLFLLRLYSSDKICKALDELDKNYSSHYRTA